MEGHRFARPSRGGGLIPRATAGLDRWLSRQNPAYRPALPKSTPSYRWGAFGNYSQFTLHCSLSTWEKRTDCHTSDIGHWFAMTCVIWWLYDGSIQRPHPALRATHNYGMIATGNHQYFNSLRGAPPLPGEGSGTQKNAPGESLGRNCVRNLLKIIQQPR